MKKVDLKSNKKTKEERQAKRADRKQAREDKRTNIATEKVRGEMALKGIAPNPAAPISAPSNAATDIPSMNAGDQPVPIMGRGSVPTGQPISADSPEAYDKKISQKVAGDTMSDIERITSAYGQAPQEEATINEQALIDSAKRERRGKWLDILYGFGQGLQGKDVDPNMLRSTKEQRLRNQQYQEYLNATKRNQQARTAFELNQRQQVVNYITKQLEDERIPAAKRQELEQQKALNDQRILDIKNQMENRNRTSKASVISAQAAATNAAANKVQKDAMAAGEGYYDPSKRSTNRTSKFVTKDLGDGSWQLSSEASRYKELFDNVTAANPTLLSEIAKASGYAVDDDGNLKGDISGTKAKELAYSFLSRIYDFSETEDGRFIATPKEGMDTFVEDLKYASDELQGFEDSLDRLYMETPGEELSRKGRRQFEADRQARAALIEEEIAKKNEQIRGMLRGSKPGEELPGYSRAQQMFQ